MTTSDAERRIRSILPVIRLMQAHIPLGLSARLNRQSARRARLPAGVTRQDVSQDGVPCVWLTPDRSPADRALLYLHGGGFVFGLTSLHLQMCAHLAQAMGVRAMMVDYRLAPGCPYPATLDDCLTAYRGLLAQGIPAQQIVLAGDSAGGNLVLTTLMKMRDRGESLPAAAACLSPVADLTGRRSPPEGYKDPLLPPKALKLYNESYVAQSAPRDPYISPVFGDFRGLPPLLIHAGEDEILREDAVRITELAVAAGVDARLEIYPRMWHVWQLYLSLPQAAASLDDIAGFLTERLGEKVPA